MRYAGFLATLVAGVMAASLGAAQTIRQAGPPQPAPPSGFGGSQYVDSRGCVYIRAGISGQVNWVPRVGADRTPICGPPPASVRPPVVAEAPATRPAEQADQTPPQTAATPRVVRQAESAPQPRTASAAPAQRIVDVPRGETRTQRVTTEAARPAEPARRLTLSQVCAGRSGPVEGFIVARTGAPVTCGAPVRAAASPSSAAPVPARVTRGEICARIARTGESFIDNATGQPVACANTVTARSATLASAPADQRTMAAPRVAAQRPTQAASAVSGAASCPGISAQAEAFLREIGAPVDCGPWAIGTARSDVPVSNVEAPAARTSTLSSRGSAAPVRAAPVAAAAPETPIFRQPVPASNPSAGNPARAIASPPSGYRSVWDDGRVNTSRGLARPYF